MPGGLNRAGNKRGMRRGSRSTQFESGSGWKGNAGGTPKGSVNMKGRLTRYLLMTPKQMKVNRRGEKMADVIAKRLILDAARGTPQAVKELFNRVEGLPKITAEVRDVHDLAAELRETLREMDEVTIGVDDEVDTASEA